MRTPPACLYYADQQPVSPVVAYNVDVNPTDGRRLLAVVGRGHHHVTIPNVDFAVGARVLVGPMRNDDTQGRTRAVTLRPRARAASG